MDKIELYCDLIKSNCRCKACGCRNSFSSEGKCECGRENKMLKKILPKLRKELANNRNIDIYDSLCLYSISKFKFDFVDDVIKNNNIDEKILSFYKDTLKDANDKKGLSELQVKFLIENSNNKTLEIDNESSRVLDYLLTNLLVGEYDSISMDSKLKLANSLTNHVLRSVINDDDYFSKVTIEKNDSDSIAYFSNKFLNSKDCFVALNRKEVKKLIEEQDYTKLIETIFHECVHAKNYYSLVNLKEVNSTNMILAKEHVLSGTLNDYYDNNYDIFLDEVLANAKSYDYTKKFIDALGFKMKDSAAYDEKIQHKKELLNNLERTVNGKRMNVDDAFDENVKSAIWLGKYPILNIEYKNVDGNLVKKSYDEVKSDYEKYLNDEISYNGNSNNIDNLYHNILKKNSINQMFTSSENVQMENISKKSM